jgi:hypothetical protein
MKIFRNSFVISASILLLAISSCNNDNGQEVLINQRAKSFFNLKENSSWVFEVISEVDKPRYAFVLQNKNRSLRKEDNSEIISYDLFKNAEMRINVRMEAGPVDFANRISFVKFENGLAQISAMFWARSDIFYAEDGDSIENLGSQTINNVDYEEVWQLKSNKAGRFKDVFIAKDYGIIYFETEDNTQYSLLEFIRG